MDGGFGGGVGKGAPIVSGGAGKIDVSGTGTANEGIKIVIKQGTTIVISETGNLNAQGQGFKSYPLGAGTYDVTVTAPFPGGTEHFFPDVVVT